VDEEADLVLLTFKVDVVSVGDEVVDVVVHVVVAASWCHVAIGFSVGAKGAHDAIGKT
jgi:hypothetical protein